MGGSDNNSNNDGGGNKVDRRRALFAAAGVSAVGGVELTRWVKPTIDMVVTPSHAHLTANDEPLFGNVSLSQIGQIQQSVESIAITNDDIVGDALSMLVPNAQADHITINPMMPTPGINASACDVVLGDACIVVYPPATDNTPNTPRLAMLGLEVPLYMQTTFDFNGVINPNDCGSACEYVISGFFNDTFTTCQGTITGSNCDVPFACSLFNSPCIPQGGNAFEDEEDEELDEGIEEEEELEEEGDEE